MRIILVEECLKGHRPVYLRNLLAGLPERLAVELHAPTGVLDHPALADLPTVIRNRISPVALPDMPTEVPLGFSSLLRHHLGKTRILRRHVRASRVGRGDVVAIPYIDDIYVGLAMCVGPWFGGARAVCVGMRNDLHLDAGSALAGGRTPPGRAKDWLQRRYLSSKDLYRHWTNQLPFAEWADRHLPGRVGFLGDPAPPPATASRADCCATLGLDPQRRHILCFGSLTPRKGVARLLRLLARSDWPADTIAVLAGRCDAEVRAALAVAPPEVRARLIVRDGFIPIDQEAVWFGAADLVWLAYEGHPFMSGCLVSAGLARRPIAACHDGLVGWYTTRFGLGFHVPQDDTAAIQAIAAHCGGSWQPASEQPFSEHLPERFAARFWDSVIEATA